MKTTGAIVIACAIMSLTEAALTSEQKENLAKAKMECIHQTGVDLQILKKLGSGEFPHDPKFKDFLVCMAKKFNLQNEAGELQKDNIIEKLGASINDASKAKQLTEKCFPNGHSSDASYQFAKCVYESTPDHIIMNK